MTKRLHAVNRWCVTVTPIQQGPEGNHSNIIIYSPRAFFLQDIYGLLLFLSVQPYCEKSLWKRLLYEPYVREKNARPLVEVLKRLFWRTLKQDVLNEVIDELLFIYYYLFFLCVLLGVPPQTEEERWLWFSPLEAFFYQREQELCSLQAERVSFATQ